MSNVLSFAKVSKNTGLTFIQDKRMKKLINQGWHFYEVMDRVDWLVMKRGDERIFISPDGLSEIQNIYEDFSDKLAELFRQQSRG